MDRRVRDIAEGTFKLEENEGNNKVQRLEEAIRRNVKPEMQLFVGGLANAAVCQVVRQFWGTSPKFTLIAEGVGNYGVALFYAGLVKKVITSVFSTAFPGTSPDAIIQKEYKRKEVEFENWSLYSLNQRLMAGALGIPFIPTRSIIGSDMAEDNKDSFQIVEDPFGGGRGVGVIKALNPDIALIHGWAADRCGNTILGVDPISGEGAWGALASRNGVIVTVEKIVSTSFIRDHSTYVNIPSYMVNSVSIAPFGAHPLGLAGRGIAGFEAYAADYDFMLDYQNSSRDPAAFETWLGNWILNCSNHEQYLFKLGSKRLSSLKGRATTDVWKYDLESSLESISPGGEYSATEMMVITAGRKIKEMSQTGAYRIIHAGVGTSGLAAWMAYYLLKKEGYDIELTMGAGWYGYAPRPADPWLFSSSNISTCKMIGSVVDTYGVWIKAENSCIAALGAGQIDECGNINSTKLPGEIYLVGSGGSNDAINAKEVVVIAPQTSRRSVEKVGYITCPGDRVRAWVSTKGIFEKLGDEPRFTLTGYFPNTKLSTPEQSIDEIKKNCGWELKVSSEVKEIPAPTFDELVLLRLFDPEGYFTKENRELR